jgi:predicted AAA+ superfamily ATPase
MIPRSELIRRLKESLEQSRVVALVGSRQCGKTTLAREFVEPDSGTFFTNCEQ